MTKTSLKTIAHFDDDPDICVIIRMALEKVGSFTLYQFDCGQAGINKVAKINPQLLLLDVMMPDMSGQEAWRKMAEIPGYTVPPAIFLTAKAEDEFSKELVQSGALAVIRKPVDPMLLAKQIEEIWQKRLEKQSFQLENNRQRPLL